MSKSPVLIDKDFVRVRVCRHGPLLYNPSDIYIGGALDRYGESSEAEAVIFRRVVQPGHWVVDIGANVGAHTTAFAQSAGPTGRVIAFEPQRIVFQMLCANVALNALDNVVAHWAAVGAAPGTTVVPSIDYRSTQNFGSFFLGDHSKGDKVPIVTLDSFDLPACHFIKMDVEGMEQQALAGARGTIMRHRPFLYVENDRAANSAGLIRAIMAMEYRLFWHLPPLFNPDNFFGEPENVFPSVVSINMFCTPREKNYSVAGAVEITSPEANWRDAVPAPEKG